MSTTLVNVGILNGRSTKLDSDDLMVLNDIVENYSTDVLVSTPEIILPDLDADAVVSTNTIEAPDVNSEILSKDLARQTHVIDEDSLIDSLRFDSAVTDSGSGSTPKEVLISSLITEPDQERATEEPREPVAEEAVSLATVDSDAVHDETEETNPSQVDAPEEPVTIELAKQAAIEAALMAASNREALAGSPLPMPPAKTASNDTVVDSPLADELDELHATEVQAEDDLSPVQRAVERMSRENIAIEEITADLLDRLETAPGEIGITPQAEEKSVAILAPTEKQFDRLVENLLEKTVPGMPSTIMITGCENSSRTGKVASAVAALLAEKNLGKILLIDGDMYEKTLTDSLINSHEPGLIEVLNRQESLETTVLPSGMQNLYFLPAGIATLSREKTMAGRMAAFNQQLKESFRFVLIDGGNSSEPVCRAFSSFCDSTYLAISLGQTFCASASNAVEDLQAAGSRLLGTIVTK